MFNDNLQYRWFLVVYDASSPEEARVNTEGLECYFFSLEKNEFHKGSAPRPIAEVLAINQQFALEDTNSFYH
jgi:hypothetical protein